MGWGSILLVRVNPGGFVALLLLNSRYFFGLFHDPLQERKKQSGQQGGSAEKCCKQEGAAAVVRFVRVVIHFEFPALFNPFKDYSSFLDLRNEQSSVFDI